MGRYAFFNTGVEYKFRFGIQSSYDMMEFEGKSYKGEDDDSLIHKWKKTDQELIKETLNIFGIDIDINKFSNDIHGTYELKCYLIDKMKITDYTCILGYIIYHQLQYTDDLSVNYEL